MTGTAISTADVIVGKLNKATPNGMQFDLSFRPWEFEPAGN